MRAAVISHGRIVAEDRPVALGRYGPSRTVIAFQLPGAQAFAQLPNDVRPVALEQR